MNKMAGLAINNSRIRKIGYLLLYTVCFGLLFGTLNWVLVRDGKSFILKGDGLLEGYTTIGYIQNMVRKKEFFLGFDFSLGLGEDNLLALSAHGFLNPIHWIIVGLFGRLTTAELYKLVLAVKFWLGGISFLTFSSYKRKNPVLSIAAALLYAFSVWALEYGVNFIWFYDVLIALPLMIRGVDELYEKESNISLWITFSLIYIGTQGFYYLFWMCLIGCAYFVIKGIERRKTILTILTKMCLNITTPLLIVAPVLLPNIYWFLISNRNVRNSFSIAELLPSVNELRTFLRSFFTPTLNTWSHYLLTSLSLFGLLVFVFNTKKHKYVTIVLGISILTMITPGIGLLLNGGGYISERGFFYVWFILVYSILCGFEDVLTSDKYIISICALFVMVYGGIITMIEKEFRTYHIRNMLIFLVLFVFLFLIITTMKEGEKAFTGYVLICTILLWGAQIAFLFRADNPIVADYANIRKANQFVDSADIAWEDKKYNEYVCGVDSWYRVNTESMITYNQSMLTGLYPTNEYFSICNPWVQLFWREIVGLEFSNFTGEQSCTSEELRKFLGVKYYESSGKMYEEYGINQIAVLHSKYVLEKDFDDEGDTFEKKMRALLDYVVLESNPVTVTIPQETEQYNINQAKSNKEIKEGECFGIEVKHNDISINTNTDLPKILLLSIPYSRGWKAYIDGERADILRADYGFIGLELQSGEHMVEMKYRTPFFIGGIYMSVVGFLLAMYLLICERKRNRIETKDNIKIGVWNIITTIYNGFGGKRK